MLYNFLNKTPRNEEIACKQFGEQAIWHTEDYFRNPQEKKKQNHNTHHKGFHARHNFYTD